MTTHEINLHFGSTFSGEGFNKLNSALQGSSGSIRKAGSIVSGIISQFDSLGGAAGTLTRQVSSLLASALSGGVWGLAATGIMTAVSSIINAFMSAEERAKKLKEQYDQLIADEFAKQSEIRAARIKAEAEAWDRVAKSVEDSRKASIKYYAETEKLREQYAATSKQEELRGTTYASEDYAVWQAQQKVNAAKSNISGITLEGLHGQAFDARMEEYNQQLANAEQELEIAVRKRKEAEDKALKAVQDEQKQREDLAKVEEVEKRAREKAENEKIQQDAKDKAARQRAEEDIKDAEKKGKEEDKSLRRQLASAVQASADWQKAESQNSAKGQTYGQWKHAQATIDKQQKYSDYQDQKQLDEAERNLANTQHALSTEKSDSKRQSLQKEAERLQQYINSKKGINTAEEEAKTIRDKISQNIEDTKTAVQHIRDNLKNATMH